MREGWTYKKLGEVCSFINDGDWIESKDQSESGIRLIQTGNIGIGEYKDKGERAKYISEDTFSNLECTEIFKGDCLVSRLPEPIGRCCILPELENRCITAVDCSILRFKTDIIPQLFVYYSQSAKYVIDVENRTTGTTRKRISRKNLEGIQIPLPPKSQQEAIVSELDEINSLLALKREQLQKYDKLAQSLFYEMFGDPVENEKGWEVKKLGEICLKITDGSHFSPSGHPDGIYPMLSVKDMKGHSFSYEDCKYINEEDYAILLKQGCKPLLNDVLVAKDGSYFKTAFVIKDEREQAILSSIAILRPDLKIVEPIYLQEMLLQKSIKDSVDRFYVTGTAIKRVILKKLGTLITILPPLPLQQQFASRIEQIESQKQQVQAAIEKLETLLASRMQYWFE